jgi:hypothetical protein
MLRLLLAFLMLGMAIPKVLASEATPYDPKESYKDMAAKELFIYGQTLFDRKDYLQSSQVFRHIVEISPEMLLSKPYIEKESEPVAAQVTPCCDTKPSEITPIAEVAPQIEDFPLLDPEIRAEIDVQDLAIQQLKEDIVQLKPKSERVSYE